MMRYLCLVYSVDDVKHPVLSDRDLQALGDAVQVTSGIPAARYGFVEVRPILVLVASGAGE